MSMQEQTQKRKYPSKYSPGVFVTGAQYVIELLCERKAALENKTLPIHFWNLSEWAKEFVSQTRIVNSLLKKYDVKTLVHVLHDNPRIYSLRANWIKSKIDAAQRLVDIDKKRKEESMKNQSIIDRETVDDKPRERIIRKNTLSKLYELDEVESGKEKEGS